MPIQTRLLTADEFLEWPDEPGCRQELIRGEVVIDVPSGWGAWRGHHGDRPA